MPNDFVYKVLRMEYKQFIWIINNLAKQKILTVP